MIPKPKKGQRTGRAGRQPSEDPAGTETKRKGRPPIEDKAAKRNVPIHVLTTKSEKDELQRAAADADMSVSTWIRKVALERARAVAVEKEKKQAHG